MHAGRFVEPADLVTPTVTSDIRCADAVRVGPSGVALTDAEIAAIDTLPDGTIAPPAGAPRPPELFPGLSGAGCSVSPGSSHAGLALLVALLGLAVRRVRR